MLDQATLDRGLALAEADRLGGGDFNTLSGTRTPTLFGFIAENDNDPDLGMDFVSRLPENPFIRNLFPAAFESGVTDPDVAFQAVGLADLDTDAENSEFVEIGEVTAGNEEAGSANAVKAEPLE